MATWWIYILIPVLSAIVGWVTNVLAVWMTFYPTHFSPLKIWQPKGQPVGLIGWQGIIPAKAVMMVELLCNVFLEEIMKPSEIFAKVDHKAVAKITQAKLETVTPAIVARVAADECPEVWMALSPHVRAEAARCLQGDEGVYIAFLIEELQARILDVLSVRAMCARIVVADPAILTGIFQEVGGQEFEFIKRSGLYFGFLFGVVQALVYYAYDAWWTLPVAGFLVGYATNWIALKLIFAPAEPVSLGCFRLQGLFLKRQHEAAAVMAATCKRRFLSQHILWPEIFRQPGWRALLQHVTERYVAYQVDKDAVRRVSAALFVGDGWLRSIAAKVAAQLAAEVPGVIELTYEYMDGVMGIEDTLRSELQAMTSTQFIGVLRPAFEQDEIKLILVGGVLGAAAGFAQHYGIFQFVE